MPNTESKVCHVKGCGCGNQPGSWKMGSVDTALCSGTTLCCVNICVCVSHWKRSFPGVKHEKTQHIRCLLSVKGALVVPWCCGVAWMAWEGRGKAFPLCRLPLQPNKLHFRSFISTTPLFCLNTGYMPKPNQIPTGYLMEAFTQCSVEGFFPDNPACVGEKSARTGARALGSHKVNCESGKKMG